MMSIVIAALQNLMGDLRSNDKTSLNLDGQYRLPSGSVMCTSHPVLCSEFALATVSVGLVFCVSIHSPPLDA